MLASEGTHTRRSVQMMPLWTAHPNDSVVKRAVELINNYIVAVHLPFPAKDPEASPGPRVIRSSGYNLGGLIWSIVS